MIGAVAFWSRRNLFAKPSDAVLSAVFIPLCVWAVWRFAWWLAAADWAVVADNIRVMLVGVYPPDALWRVWTAAAILAGLSGASLGAVLPSRTVAAAIAAVPAALLAAVSGAGAGGGAAIAAAGLLGVAVWTLASPSNALRASLPYLWGSALIGVLVLLAPPGIQTWGGLLLSVLITLVASILTIPIGILLAFGRRSRIASLRVCCTAYIEVMRSVPLILVVYWIWIILPLLTGEVTVPDVARGMIGFVLFFSAYVAEYVRSGLQSVSKGQVEAAQSLGMSTFQVNYDIVLPQALRVAVPALVGNVLDIFNAAPLVFIIGLTDFLRAGQMVLANPVYSDSTYEIYVFLFAVYFAIGSLITFAARRLEAHLGKGAR